LKFLFDNNLSPHLAKALDALSEPHGIQVVHLRDKFAPATPDDQWIDALAKEGGWSIISHDRFAKNSLEKEALRKSGLITFILARGWASLDGWHKAHLLVRWWPVLMQQAGLVSSGAFIVPTNFSGKGKLEPVQI
jgi:hypothetical protein